MFKTEQITISKIDISQIDINDETYRISSFMDVTALACSIKEIGLLNPPVVKKGRDKDHDKWIIVSGFRRIKAMILNKAVTTMARIIPDHLSGSEFGSGSGSKFDSESESGSWAEPESGPCAEPLSNGGFDGAALVAVMENAFQRPLGIMEQARGVVLLKNFMDQGEIAAKSMSIFNLKMNSSLVKKLFLLGSMPGKVHDLIESGNLSMAPALRLNTFDAETLNAFISLFGAVKFGLNKQMEIITNISEIAIREDISPCKLIESHEIAGIMNDGTIDRSRKGSLLRSFLVKQRYPHLKTAEEKFKKNLKKLGLAGELRLDAPVNFEAMDYSVSFKFKNCDELEKRIEKLLAVSRNPLLRQMIS